MHKKVDLKKLMFDLDYKISFWSFWTWDGGLWRVVQKKTLLN